MDHGMNPFGSPIRRAAALLLLTLASAASAVAADGSTVMDPGDSISSYRVALEPSLAFGEVRESPLLEIYNARRTTGIESPDLGVFARIAATSAPLPRPTLAAANVEARDALPPPAPQVSDSMAVASRPIDAQPRSAGPPPDPVAIAIEAALVRLVVHDGPVNPLGAGDWRDARVAIGVFYAERAFQPVWVDGLGLTRAGRSVLEQLGRAPEDGLNLAAFALPRDLPGTLNPTELADAETTISAAVVAYAEQATGSRVPPARISRLISAASNVADPGDALTEIAAASDPAARLADFNPPQQGYRALRDELKRLTEAQRSPGRSAQRTALGLTLGVSKSLLDDGVDDISDPRIDGETARIKTRPRKAAFGTSPRSAGLDPSARQRAAILANMEMWRWEPRSMGERRIEINVADFSASVLDGDTVIHHARVVVGKPDTPTPIFSNVMRYLLINPSWQVPDSIIRREMLPRLAADPGYLSRRGYEVKTVAGRLTVRQRPGEDNALGRIAFMFPNDYAVYLHDTPSQTLFDSEMRAFSHGCIRVEDPLRLAELVLGWPESRINAAIGGPERTVFLPQPLPIHIEYFTEFVDEFGELQERPDVYGLMQRVADILSTVRQD
jgi:murein L,D-transpeptidase YcbB/YkuD